MSSITHLCFPSPRR